MAQLMSIQLKVFCSFFRMAVAKYPLGMVLGVQLAQAAQEDDCWRWPGPRQPAGQIWGGWMDGWVQAWLGLAPLLLQSQSLRLRGFTGYLTRGNSSPVLWLLWSLFVIKIHRSGRYNERQNLQNHQYPQQHFPAVHSCVTGGTSTLGDLWSNSAAEGGLCGSWDAGQPRSLFYLSLTLCTRCHQLGSCQSVASGTKDNGAGGRHGAIQPVQEAYTGDVKRVG